MLLFTSKKCNPKYKLTIKPNFLRGNGQRLRNGNHQPPSSHQIKTFNWAPYVCQQQENVQHPEASAANFFPEKKVLSKSDRPTDRRTNRRFKRSLRLCLRTINLCEKLMQSSVGGSSSYKRRQSRKRGKATRVTETHQKDHV